MNVSLSDLIGNLLQRFEGLQQQLPQGSVPEGVFAELLANENLSEEAVAQLTQALDQSFETEQTLFAELANRMVGRLSEMQAHVDESVDGLEDMLLSDRELSIVAAAEDVDDVEPVERLRISGPPDHRALPDVDLPESAVAHALHSNGAPFVQYQTEEPVAVVVDEVTEVSSGDPPEAAPPVSPEVQLAESLESTVVDEIIAAVEDAVAEEAVVPDEEATAAAASVAASVVVTETDPKTRPDTPRPSESALSTPGADFRSARATSVLAALRAGESPGRPGEGPVLGSAPAHPIAATDEGKVVEPAPPPNSNAPPASTSASGAARSTGIAAADIEMASVVKPEVVAANAQANRAPIDPVPAPSAQVSLTAVAPLSTDGAAEVARANAAPLSDAPVVTIRNVGNVAIQSIRHLIGSGEQTITIKLVPESLGQLQITVTSGDDSVEVALAAASQSVRHVLENQLHALREALSREGIDVSRATVTVTTGGDSDANLARNQSGQFNGFGRGTGRLDHGLGYHNSPGTATQSELVHSTRPQQGRLNVLV